MKIATIENCDQIKVSVIVPIYNVEKYLDKCIESIVHQTYKNLEIILVDDGAIDSSGIIADESAQKDNRIQVIHQQNAGVSCARNVGLKAATGDYVCFVDGDDYIMPDYVWYLLKLVLEEDADISLTTDVFSNYNTHQNLDPHIDIVTPEVATERMLCYHYPIGVYCKMFKRDFLEKKNIRFLTDIFIGEGFNFNMAALQRANRIVEGHRKIYFYRRDNSTSAMTAFSINKWENGLKAIEEIKENLIFKTKKIERAWKFAWWRTNSDAYDSIRLANAQNEHREMYIKCLRVVRRQGYCSLTVPINKAQRMRAIVMMVFPSLIPYLIKLRKKKYIGEVS